MNLRLLATVYAIIFVAELPDKTALASLILATEYDPFPVFVGAASALTGQSLIAVSLGQLMAMLPTRPVHVVSGLVFLASAIAMWRRTATVESSRQRGAAKAVFWQAFLTVFSVVFVAEWGDLTQIGTGALAARYRAPVTVFLGATLALWSVVAIVVFVGNRGAKALSPQVTKRVAAVVFAAVGGALLVR